MGRAHFSGGLCMWPSVWKGEGVQLCGSKSSCRHTWKDWDLQPPCLLQMQGATCCSAGRFVQAGMAFPYTCLCMCAALCSCTVPTEGSWHNMLPSILDNTFSYCTVIAWCSHSGVSALQSCQCGIWKWCFVVVSHLNSWTHHCKFVPPCIVFTLADAEEASLSMSAFLLRVLSWKVTSVWHFFWLGDIQTRARNSYLPD